eukprot:2839389-Alexandrium_andersonii.AAC.1
MLRARSRDRSLDHGCEAPGGVGPEGGLRAKMAASSGLGVRASPRAQWYGVSLMCACVRMQKARRRIEDGQTYGKTHGHAKVHLKLSLALGVND